MAKAKRLFLAALILRLALACIAGYHPDILNHVDWGRRFWEYGPAHFYQGSVWSVSWPNQPPGAIFLFAIIAKAYQGIFSFLWWLNLRMAAFPSFIFPFLESKFHIILLKLPFLLADLGIGWLIWQKTKWGAVLFLFNPALIYNSAIWGQTDSLVNFLTLLSFWLAINRKQFWAILAFAAGLTFKLSLVIWLPILAIVLFQEKMKKKEIFLGMVSSFVLIYGLALLFLSGVQLWRKPLVLWQDYVFNRQGEMLSGNAFNLWSLVYGIDLSLKKNIPFFYTTAEKFGQIITIFMMAITTLIFLRRKKKDFLNTFWLMLLYSLGSFLFLTNMHERYLYPLFAPLAILVAARKIDIKYYFVLSLIHLLNIYNLWWYPRVGFIKSFLEFNHSLIPRLLSLVLIFIFLKLSLTWVDQNNYNSKEEVK